MPVFHPGCFGYDVISGVGGSLARHGNKLSKHRLNLLSRHCTRTQNGRRIRCHVKNSRFKSDIYGIICYYKVYAPVHILKNMRCLCRTGASGNIGTRRSYEHVTGFKQSPCCQMPGYSYCHGIQSSGNCIGNAGLSFQYKCKRTGPKAIRKDGCPRIKLRQLQR